MITGCEDTPVAETTEPRLYNLHGWYSASVAIYPYGQPNKAADVDIDGVVGHPLSVGGPTMRTEPRSASWTCSYRINTGSLPPGMSMGTNGDITGIPTERGHWIVSVECYDVHFQGSSYNGIAQQLRFHVTGSGTVNE